MNQDSPESIDQPFETETMADLHARQGRLGEAIAIYRRLVDGHPAHPARAGWQDRARSLEARLANQEAGPITAHDIPRPDPPGVVAAAGRGERGESAAIVVWALPPTPSPPVLEILLVTRGADGIETARRRVTATASSGQLVIPTENLHSVAAAAGHLAGDRFVVLARSPRD